jgi:hypothetical protein
MAFTTARLCCAFCDWALLGVLAKVSTPKRMTTRFGCTRIALDPLTLMEPTTVASGETVAAAVEDAPIPFQSSRQITTPERAILLRFCVFIIYLRSVI